MSDQTEKIADLERQLAEQTRRADVAEAWQKRLTTLLARGGKDFPKKGKDFPLCAASLRAHADTAGVLDNG